MRVSKEHAEKNRDGILGAAARLFREHGIRATGIDAISRRAGLTHGAVYSRFASKEALAAEAIRLALRRSRRAWQRVAEGVQPRDAYRRIVDGYLSPAHRDAPGAGCVVAALGASIAREPRAVRRAFTEELEDAVALLADVVPGTDPAGRRDDAIAAFACMTGALILARAVDDERLSKRILRSARTRLLRGGRRAR